MVQSRPHVSEQPLDFHFRLLLLGPPRILIHGHSAQIDRHKAIALLAYLAMTGVEHHRDALAEMLWPEFDRTRARGALRRVLASLTHVIPGEWLEIERDTLHFRDCPEEIFFDVREFRDRLCQAPSHDHPDDDMCKDCLDTLTAAVHLYEGDFMEGFTLEDCPGFDDWQRNQGDELRNSLTSAIDRLVRCHAGRKEYETAIRYGKRWARIDPLDEQARLGLIRVYQQAGQSNAALREYEEFARFLQAELGVAPQDELTCLYQSIKAGRQPGMPALLKPGHLVEDLPVPTSIHEVILERVNHISSAAQRILLQAALLGQQFDAGVLSGLCDIDEETLFRALEEAEQARLINETSTSEGLQFTFSHIQIPLVLRESLSGLRRRREHQRIADFLAVHAPEDTSALAYHYAEAENRPKAIAYAQLAARKAMEMNVYEDALKHLRAALDLLKNTSPSELRLSILEDYGDVYRMIGEGSQAVAVYQEAQDVWRSLPRRERWTGVRLQRKVGETVANMNQFTDVQRLAPISRAGLETGLAAIKDEPPHPEKVRLLAALSRDAWYMRSHIDWPCAENYAARAVEVAESLGQPVELSIALEALAAVYGLKGKLRERVDICRRRLELSFDPSFLNLKERVNIYLQTGMALYDVGEYLLALEHLREAESLARQIGDIPKQADAIVRQGQCLFRLDRWDDLLAVETQIRGLQSRFTYKRMGVLTCFYYAIQSAVYTWRGDINLGKQLKTEAHEVMLSIAGSEQSWLRNQHY